MNTIELYKKCNELASIRTRVLMLIILSEYVFAEEKIRNKEMDGGTYEFSCEIDELDVELQKYIDSYSDEYKKQVGL